MRNQDVDVEQGRGTHTTNRRQMAKRQTHVNLKPPTINSNKDCSPIPDKGKKYELPLELFTLE